MAHLFRGLRFYVASTGDKAELEQLIAENGGTMSDSPERATQLVDCDKLDARHLERISTAFITDSVAFRTLQDPLKYSGKIFTTKQMQRRTEGRGRMTYTNEDDARMLHFAKLRGWKAMESVPESVWRLAGNERVTTHSAQSMHEHFRKQLKNKTPSEQRTIMTKAAAMARAQLLEQEDEEEQEMQRGGTNPNLTGFSDVAVSADRQRASMLSSIETRLKEVQEEKFNKRTRSRKPTSPLRISQRRRSDESDSDTSESADKDTTSPSPKASFQPSTVTPTRATPAAPNTSAAISNSPIQPSSTTSVTPIGPNGGRQKRKRGTPGSDATISQQSSSSRQYSSDAESVESKGENGISFRSVWSELVRNHSKRRLLQSFFEARVPPESQQSSTGPAIIGASLNKGWN
ncbi:Hypothetical protein PHPALM_10917 [Phytophthora palmivora]|uniref:Telomeric repeat-binding factor 2-interacting protein 1 n=1 Tax=Phytophthora palmivora TaxID=4796 RepID=A0A2P4Y3L8_9STRA|nr:Hypothetical protein PHPALM_10917 [Phytophthora palmivora]